jgi:hypothetical protein
MPVAGELQSYAYPFLPTNAFANTPAPCWTGSFDQGDGLVVKNGAHDVQATGAKIRSKHQASIHVLSGGDYLRVTGNALGAFDLRSSGSETDRSLSCAGLSQHG